MPNRSHGMFDPAGDHDESTREPDRVAELRPLHLLTAPMLLLSGVEATLDSLSRTRSRTSLEIGEGHRETARAPLAAVWAPSLLAPVAAAAQIARLSRPSESASAASRILNAAVVGAGIAATAGMLVDSRRSRRAPSLAPLAAAAAGLLGLVLDRQEARIIAERERMEKRARIVERLIPRRRPRLDRVVVHV